MTVPKTHSTLDISTFVSSTRAFVPRPESHFLDVSHNPPACARSAQVAREVVEAWQPGSVFELTPLPMANGGMATYTGHVNKQPVFVKSLQQKTLDSDVAAAGAAKTAAAREGALAQFAGEALPFAPKVHYVHDDGLGFVTHLLNATEISPSAARGSLRRATTHAFGQIHALQPRPLIEIANEPWYSMIDVSECLAASGANRRDIDALIQLEVGINRCIQTMPFAQVPCHNDLKVRNILVSKDGVNIIDWDRFALGDPMRDLAYHAVTADIGPASTRAFLADYSSQLASSKQLSNDDAKRYAIHLARYYNKNQAFFAQWPDAQDKRAYFARHLADQVQAISETLRDKAGLTLKLAEA